MSATAFDTSAPGRMPQFTSDSENVALSAAMAKSQAKSCMNAPPTQYGTVTEEQVWENMTIFLKKVVPVAEKAGVKLAVHPDDPPFSPIRDVARILINVDAFQRVIDIAPSPNNGITFCQGSFASMNVDIPAAIRHFGRQKQIHFVHFRDVRGTAERFVETFVDEGPTDMAACIRAYREAGVDAPLRTDHSPTLSGDAALVPGYPLLGRLHAVGYVQGLLAATA